MVSTFIAPITQLPFQTLATIERNLMEVEEQLVEEVLDEDDAENSESRSPSPTGSTHLPLHVYQQTERPLITGSLRSNRTSSSMKNDFMGPQSMSLRSNRPVTHRTVSAAGSEQRGLYPTEAKIIKKLSTSSFLSED
jgi:hypothetical protein